MTSSLIPIGHYSQNLTNPCRPSVNQYDQHLGITVVNYWKQVNFVDVCICLHLTSLNLHQHVTRAFPYRIYTGELGLTSPFLNFLSRTFEKCLSRSRNCLKHPDMFPCCSEIQTHSCTLLEVVHSVHHTRVWVCEFKSCRSRSTSTHPCCSRPKVRNC